MKKGSKKSKADGAVACALIMAAGYGTRLEPLTLAVPKPMMPIVNKPIMQHNLELLKKHGIKKAVCNIHYFPEQIENYFFDGEDLGVALTYSYEENLLGTAGGVRKMGREVCRIRDTFLVLSSDALTDVDLGKAVEFHKKKRALATLVLSKVENPSNFGVVVLDEQGRITAFQEKPKKEEALSNLVNTGIYIFEPEILDLIPAGQFYDFGHELFPALANKESRIFGWEMDGYWSDVGSISAYKKANLEVLSGKVQVGVPGKKEKGNIYVEKNVRIAPSAKITGAAVISAGTIIEDDVILENVVLGARSVVSTGTTVKNSVIWSDSIILSSAKIEDSVVGSWCFIGKEANVNSSVIANRCSLSGRVNLPAGSTMSPGTELLC